MDIDNIYKKYRCFSTHNSVIGLDCTLVIGTTGGNVFDYKDGKPYVFLIPLFTASKKAVVHFLNNAKRVVYQSKQLDIILKG
jgi:hypothetical protein